ncbi:hypothetical protein K438DRAFT_1848539 [Mycena galopus ATCC 62051]|nr:hypothetical protein K438DRAFT_1848539 [Mycena galopus ATCC 62051]
MDNEEFNCDARFGETPAQYDQLPTPPDSRDSSSVADGLLEGKSTVISVSSTFAPDAQRRPKQPDLVLLSQDSVYFYVHADLLLVASENRFRAMLPLFPSDEDEPPILNVPESSAVLNVILHAIYDLSCVQYSPPFSILVNAVDSMPTYGIIPKSTILPSTALFAFLLLQAPLFPLQLYVLAGHYDLLDLAVPTSSHLLGYPTSRITDEDAERMGPIYLKRLFFLHYGRAEALKRELGPAPGPHLPTPSCDFDAQKGVGVQWALATAHLMWDIRPDISTSSLESALQPVAARLSCGLCKDALEERIRHLRVRWSLIKRTI